MPVNTDIRIPFIPQEGITSQILQAIQLANEHHHQGRQEQLQQQQLQQQGPLTQAQTGLVGAQTGQAQANTADIQQQIEQRKIENDIRKRAMEYVFGAGTGGGSSPELEGQPGAASQKPGLISDLSDLKKGLGVKEGTPDAAQLDSAAKSMRLGMIQGKFDDSKLQEAVKDIQDRQGKKDTDLSPTYRMEGNQWFKDMHTADGKLAYSVPTVPPADYLAHHTEGTDYMRAVDAQTGKVTITPISTDKITTPILPGQPTPKAAAVGAPAGVTPGPGGSFELPGGGRKLTEAGQSMVTGLSQATDLLQPAIEFLSKKPPNWVDWQKARIGYAAGINPSDPELANVFQAIGLARSIATGPLLHGIRNRSIVQGIQQHLPDTSDSPALALQKMKDLLPFWKQAMAEVYKTENIKNPEANLSPGASKYLQSIGVAP